MTTADLKPCPFCGKDSAVVTVQKDMFIVACPHCGAQGGPAQTADRATRDWNTSAPADRIATQELDALKALVERLGNSREVGQPGERLPPLVEQVYLRIVQLEAENERLKTSLRTAEVTSRNAGVLAMLAHDPVALKQELADASEQIVRLVSERDAALRRYDELSAKYAACEDKRGDTLALNAKLVEALDDANVALGNLINPNGHEGVLLRKHPQPCRGLDFCVVHDAQERHDKVRMALTAALDAAGKGAG